jgi:cellulose synthase/poly-beta-1,6-N-acetylglucosamine synthase-like glycosyltransferase
MAEQAVFGLVVVALVFGNLDFQISRLAYFRRLLEHRPVESNELDALFDGDAPPITILVPSYMEEVRIIRQTVLSAALQQYPNREVVLLIDDPPESGDPDERLALDSARELVAEIEETLRKEAWAYRSAWQSHLERRERGLEAVQESRALSQLYDRAADWFDEQASGTRVADHTDHLFVELVLRKQARIYAERADAWRARAADSEPAPRASELAREYQRLVAIFDVTLTSFERKRFVNLSHEPNKAMNLNSYLSLMGGHFRSESRPDGSLLLVNTSPERAMLSIADVRYVITLDADSLLDPTYALRLAQIMEQPEQRRLAVIQTPYSAIPNATRTLERVSGATTDIQYVIDQGSTRHDATFWIGANALIRKAALEDIRESDEERGFRIQRYIQDRTVIEDTESSVDLIDRGWSLFNYPERLSYSATPDDFGSLLIQRRRWANGGLIILPKLLRYIGGKGLAGLRWGEIHSRLHYLVSIPAVTLGVLCLLFYPFEQNLRSLWFPLTAVSYFALYGRDLVQAGYPLGDLFRVYVLNLMLLPINLGGVLKSLQQAWTRQKIPFSRTPKVAGRVSAPAGYVLAEYAILAGLLVITSLDLFAGRWLHAGFGAFSTVCFAYAVRHFVGVRESLEDLRRPLRARRRLDESPPGARAVESSQAG